MVSWMIYLQVSDISVGVSFFVSMCVSVFSVVPIVSRNNGNY